MAALFNHKVFQYSFLLMALLCISAFALTESPLWLAPPFIILLSILFLYDWTRVYWMLLFFVPLSIQIWMLNDQLSTSLPDEPLTWLFLGAGLLMLFHRPKIIPKWWLQSKVVTVVMIMYIWTIITVIFSQEPLFSLKFLAAKSWMLMAFFIMPIWLLKEKKDLKKAAWLLLIPTLITILVIFGRHGLQYNFKFWKVEHAIDPLYFNHVDYSTFISMMFPVLWAVWVLTPKRWWWIKLSLVGLMCFYLVAVYMSYARAAVLAVIFAFTILAAIRVKLVNWVMPLFFAFSVSIIAWFATGDNYMSLRPNFEKTYMREHFIDHIKATFKGKDMSSMERLYRWIAGARMSTDQPLVGYGPGSFYYYYKPYAVTTFRTYVSRNPEGSTSHNYFLFMLTEQGWPALILYGILIMVVFAQAQKTYFRFQDRFYKIATLSVAMIFAACFVNNFFSELIETHKIGALFYLSLASLVFLSQKSKQTQSIDKVQEQQ